MNNTKIWLSSPHMGGNEQKYVNEAFETNWVAPLGPNVNGFEQDLERYLGENLSVAALSSGTAALHLALILLDIKAGDEVICQSMTFSASANPIVYQGAIPIFVDSESETWNMCPIALEEAIKDRISKGKKPKAIIAVHLYGMPYKHDQIKAISQKYQIPVVEDSAEALGSSYRKQKCGTLGDISILSFNGNKIITTSGGGALVTDDISIKQKAVFLSTQARDDAPHYQHSHIGYNYRMSNVCAGIGRGQMEVLNKHVELRREMNQFYKAFFVNIPNVIVLSEPTDNFYSNHWLSAVLLESYEQREALRLAFEKANIETRPLWKPMHLQPIFKSYPHYGARISEDLFERGLCLPSGSNLTESEKERILSELQLFFR
ncbi:aminotransferase class I/II-fold pyridoxal phosphate-dependent enzyme [Flavobacterium columnare]|uniref:aminotransferase class I/II-fold pyridoxal phosphate-dependent enzyme n=1 Tax=Flavobacterium columnare TaxID=996 RepID=UPI000D1A91FE|nr:aminotransferase class I/II-fold pyridoxal phosphate-dependent enzyme [Flavobacterium columnare]MBF6652516.1 pyridoxal phosphate-dependent aminotransferase [Flavobacterium columnare]MBF6655530.1 pyridoxal phosphate-dependent aminotransferase [Flavobacterium columnare]MBF6658385.1 pyridoxal phosphate-dependent aminotransferase [Flavobacterium columnare]PTD14824.1 pyridoxal phosphate-dependent aminotransferase [Flavobacterium columnare]QOG89162.1 aminotransferase class I/II-fold pyridoxal pho